jgi:hypothetical protein
VAGDVTLDWNLAIAGSGYEFEAPWTDANRTTAYCQRGGAALLGELVAEVTDGTHVQRIQVPESELRPDSERYHHSYALWKESREGDGSSWRVERFLGVQRALAADGGGAQKPDRDPSAADLAVLDDGGLNFRRDDRFWPQAIRNGSAAWVLVKMADPVAEGPLWAELLARPERVAVVIAVNDLRLAAVQVSRELSWERTAEDLLWELVHNPRVNSLSRCAHVVVSFNRTGALLLSKDRDCKLFFDQRFIERSSEDKLPGRMIGHTSSLTASIARELLRDPQSPTLDRAIQRGVSAMRTLHRVGYGDVDPGTRRTRLRFPLEAVAAELVSDSDDDPPLLEADVRDPSRFLRAPGPSQARPRRPPLWRILVDRYPDRLDRVAEQVVLDGVEARLKDVPLAEFGKLVTVDRQEIEAFRSIRTLILEYAGRERPERPLSIAVFGPPGAGKSFGVSQIAKSILPKRIEKLTFNLSQLDDAQELRGPFHQIRDVGLGGKLPLVFWDEFDSALGGHELGWLRHFLVPMQDGTFQEGPLTHPIGPAVFVFAGGTRTRMEEFTAEQGDEFRNAKGPDFVSRLKGFVDVLGPNPRDDDETADPYYLVRRAILLRGFLSQEKQLLRRETLRDEESDEETVERLQIDPGVLRALLQTRKYRHGARSLESIIAMSQLGGASRFFRSALPAEAQLDLHVDGREFLALVQAPELDDPALLDRLAEQMHVAYCEGMLAHGLGWKESNDDYLLRHDRLKRFAGKRSPGAPTHETLVSWERLSEDDKEQNRDLVRDIPRKLVRAGYVMLSARSGDPPGVMADEDVEFTAEEEHERWLWKKLRTGWRYAPERNDAKLEHDAILPWRRLSAEENAARYREYADRVGDGEISEEEQKWKDRVLVRAIPIGLATAGYTIAKVADDHPRAQPRSERRVVRIGVTGHRILADVDRVEAGIEEALRRVEQRWPGRPLTVVSALAEGADRLVVREVLARPGGRLVAVLPLPPDDYLTDFADESSKSEFTALLDQAEETIELPLAPTRDAAYESGGEYVLEHCDVLLTVWDGQGAQGQGGTGGTVARARERGLPIAWVHAGNRNPGTLEPTTLGDDQGVVTFENLRDGHGG